jgi:pimeloyl-ACP methyl ester carboxylesterase
MMARWRFYRIGCAPFDGSRTMKENPPHVRKRSFYIHLRGCRLSGEAISLSGEQASNTGAPALVFLHEGLGSIGQWRDFPLAVCAGAGLPGLVYERRGHGKSDPLDGPRSRNYLHEEALDVLPAVLDQSGISAAILIGHSDGGSMALLFAAEYPGRVLGIVTEAAHVFVEDVTLEGIRKAVALYGTTNLKTHLQKYHGEKTDGLFHAWADTWLAPSFRDWNIESCLPRVRCPLLVIQGRDDEYGTPAQVEAIVKQAGGPARPLIIPNCGHIPHHQAKEQVLAAVVPFVSAVTLKSV